MKKVLVLLICILISGCKSDTSSIAYNYQVETIDDNSILANGIGDDINHNGLFSINLSECKNCEAVREGDIIAVEDTGTILESYPAQISAVNLKLVERPATVLLTDNWFYQGNGTIDEMNVRIINNTDQKIFLSAIPKLEKWNDEKQQFMKVESNITGCGMRDEISHEWQTTLFKLGTNLDSGRYRLSFNISKEAQDNLGEYIYKEFEYDNIPDIQKK